MEILIKIYQYSGYLQIAIWLVLCYKSFQKHRFWNDYYRYFYYFLFIITFLELANITTSVSKSFNNNNLFIGYFYTPCEFVLLGMFLQGVIKIRNFSLFVYASSILFIIFDIYNAFWGQGYLNLNTNGDFILNLYLIALSLWAYTALFKEVDGKKLFKRPSSWIVLSILLIYSTGILVNYLIGISYSILHYNFLYSVLITFNLLKSCYLLLYLKGISLIEK